MGQINETEKHFMELLKSLPSVDYEKELMSETMNTLGNLSTALLSHMDGKDIPDTTIASYLALTTLTFLNGCKDMEMASLSAKTQLITRFEQQLSEKV